MCPAICTNPSTFQSKIAKPDKCLIHLLKLSREWNFEETLVSNFGAFKPVEIAELAVLARVFSGPIALVKLGHLFKLFEFGLEAYRCQILSHRQSAQAAEPFPSFFPGAFSVSSYMKHSIFWYRCRLINSNTARTALLWPIDASNSTHVIPQLPRYQINWNWVLKNFHERLLLIRDHKTFPVASACLRPKKG